ncbi:MAG: NlpC/P60 family protein [Verrucomicrobiota bacterium]
MLPVIGRTPLAYSTLAPKPTPIPAPPAASSRLNRFLLDCRRLSTHGLTYQFGSNDPRKGGFDCSGVIEHLLLKHGISEVPRTAQTQWDWLERRGTLNATSRWSSPSRVHARLRPGDLLFWRGTYSSNDPRKITHVMVYLGPDSRSGKPMMFGASSRRSGGIHGNGVDIFEFKYPNKYSKGTFAGYGRIPGM